jgi:hypothetical protein
MAACDRTSKFIQRVSGTFAATFQFPTSTVAKTEGTNTTVSCGAGVATTVLAANANRRFAIIMNNTANALAIRMGAAAVITSLVFPAGSSFIIDINTIGEINRQLVSVFNPTGGALNVGVYEE